MDPNHANFANKTAVIDCVILPPNRYGLFRSHSWCRSCRFDLRASFLDLRCLLIQASEALADSVTVTLS
ncbi:MAG: hypothetical protein DME99_04455 [Verrucomicrobia bacterium]|nr:MAG: hypothetical protein DME99_04455 [Verrucomicrobiota bacterium]